MNIYTDEQISFISSFNKLKWTDDAKLQVPSNLLKYRPGIVKKLVEFNINEIFCKTCGTNITLKVACRVEAPQYCSIKCYKLNPEAGKLISKIKTAIYNDPNKKAEIEAKKIASNIKNFGVAHPMQNPQIHEKQQDSCFKRTIIDGLSLQGYEPFVYKFLKTCNYTIVRGSLYLQEEKQTISWLDIDLKKKRYAFPDFFVPELNSFIEVKSDYTLEQGKDKIDNTITATGLLGYGYILAIYTPKVGIVLQYFNQNYILDHG